MQKNFSIGDWTLGVLGTRVRSLRWLTIAQNWRWGGIEALDGDVYKSRCSMRKIASYELLLTSSKAVPAQIFM
jgi:hypothetical protein